MGSKPSYVLEHNIPPVGTNGNGGYIYKVDDIHMYKTGEIVDNCFLVRNDPVTFAYNHFRLNINCFNDLMYNVRLSSKYNVGYITNRANIAEKFDILKKLYDNNLCDVYFSMINPRYFFYTLKLDKLDDFKQAANYKMSYIMNGYEAFVYPIFVYRYLGKDPVQKSEDEMRLEQYNKMLAGEGENNNGGDTNVEGAVVANLDTINQI